MPGEKRKRKHSIDYQQTEQPVEGKEIKKRKKEKAGKEKRKKKKLTDDVVDISATEPVAQETVKPVDIETVEIHDSEKKQKKKKKKRKVGHREVEEELHGDDGKMVEKLSNDSANNESKSDKKKRKKKKEKEQRKSKPTEDETNLNTAKLATERQTIEDNPAGDEQTDKTNDDGKSIEKLQENDDTLSDSKAPASEPSSFETIAEKGLGNNAPGNPSVKSEADGKELDDTRLPRTLFVGNIPVTTKRTEISRIFSQYGAVESLRIRNVIPVNPKIPKRVALLAGRIAKFSNSVAAYVVFKESPDIEQVLEKAVAGTNMTIFKDHHLRVTKALYTKGKVRQSIFVGNLPFDCSDEELIRAFAPIAKECGAQLVNVRVNRDKDTGVGRGVGFVSFDDIVAIQASLNKAGEIKIRGRDVRMERAFKAKNMKSKSYKRRRKAVAGSG